MAVKQWRSGISGWIAVVGAMAGGGDCEAQASKAGYRFDFGPGRCEPGYIPVLPTTTYTTERGHGFDLGSRVVGVDRGGDDALRGDYCTGETLKGFVAEKRLEKILSTIRPGDYLFLQFGHNDQKERGAGVGAFTTYKESLARFVADARRLGAWPVLVTPMNRRSFGPDGQLTNSLGDYPEAVRQAARELGVPLIDLNALSKPFYEALGPEGSKKAFVDNTHHNNYGSYELARCVVEGIRQNKLDLARFLVDDRPPFDPSHPDPVESFRLPASPSRDAAAPDGS